MGHSEQLHRHQARENTRREKRAVYKVKTGFYLATDWFKKKVCSI